MKPTQAGSYTITYPNGDRRTVELFWMGGELMLSFSVDTVPCRLSTAAANLKWESK